MAPALVLEHEADAPAGLLADWAAARGIALDVVSPGDATPGDVDGRPFVVSLGSEARATDVTVPWLAAERAILDRAVGAGVPVLGICFGAQHLALALGGTVGPATRPEIGWMAIRPVGDPGDVPSGPWLAWHRDTFSCPPRARLLATSAVCPQAFRQGPHLGVQFHPEATAAIAADWARSDREALTRAGTTAAAIREGAERHGPAAARAAFALFDGFLADART